jgi:hypothetical protein
MFNNQSGVIKSCVIALAVLVVVMGSVGYAKAISIGHGNYPVYCADFSPMIWNCGHTIVDDSGVINRTNNSAFSGDNIKWRLLVLDKNGIDEMRNVFATLENISGTGNNIQVNCAPEEILKKGQEIDASCIAKIAEEKITTVPSDNTLRYYTCSLNVENSEIMRGEYKPVFQASDSGCEMPGYIIGNENWILNPSPVYPNPEAIINYDLNLKTLIVSGNDKSITVNKTEICQDKKCYREIENYILTNPDGNKLNIAFQHNKLSSQDTFNFLSLQYNNDMAIKLVGKFSLIDTKNKLSTVFSNKTVWISIEFNKLTNKTRIIKFENRGVSNSIINGQYNVLIKTNNGSLSYELVKIVENNSINNSGNSDLNNTIDANGKINCNWRPYTDENGCYAIFGNNGQINLGGKIGRCIQCQMILGYYFNGKNCITVSGCGIRGDFKLFNRTECEQRCLS